jgi:hypothetical protein
VHGVAADTRPLAQRDTVADARIIQTAAYEALVGILKSAPVGYGRAGAAVVAGSDLRVCGSDFPIPVLVGGGDETLHAVLCGLAAVSHAQPALNLSRAYISRPLLLR